MGCSGQLSAACGGCRGKNKNGAPGGDASAPAGISTFTKGCSFVCLVFSKQCACWGGGRSFLKNTYVALAEAGPCQAVRCWAAFQADRAPTIGTCSTPLAMMVAMPPAPLSWLAFQRSSLNLHTREERKITGGEQTFGLRATEKQQQQQIPGSVCMPRA